MGFLGVVGRILEHIPFAISIAERMMGGGKGTAKKAAAAREIVEFISELVERNPLDEWEEVSGLEIDGLIAALQDEKVFTDKLTAVNDAVVDLVNYINGKMPKE